MIHLPEPTPKHLIKFQDTESKQYAYCKSIGCYFGCIHCISYSESNPVPTTMPIKEKIIKTDTNPGKYDNLAKKCTNKAHYDHDHPLFSYILEVFTDEKA